MYPTVSDGKELLSRNAPVDHGVKLLDTTRRSGISAKFWCARRGDSVTKWSVWSVWWRQSCEKMEGGVGNICRRLQRSVIDTVPKKLHGSELQFCRWISQIHTRIQITDHLTKFLTVVLVKSATLSKYGIDFRSCRKGFLESSQSLNWDLLPTELFLMERALYYRGFTPKI